MLSAAEPCEGMTRYEEQHSLLLLHQFFEFQAIRRPNHAAIEFCGERITYAALDRHANQIANYLTSRGLGAGNLIGIYLKKSPRMYAVMLGILKAGAGYVPIDPKAPLGRIQSIADDARLGLIVSEYALADSLESGVVAPLLRLDTEQDGLAACSASPVHHENDGVTPSGLSYVIFTSGSTGRPKGVMIEHRNAVAFVRSLENVYRINEDDRVYQGFSTAFDASVEEIWAAFSRGGTLVVPTEEVERSPADVTEFVNANNITYFSTVPTMLGMIDQDLPTVRTLVLGGEACSNELVTRWAKPGRRMLNTYGPTEATVVATWSECEAGQPVTIGKALPGYFTLVLDENKQKVEPGESGELYIGGAGVGRGYMNLKALTDERFIANPITTDDDQRLYRTYDHVRLGEDGQLHFLGRLDDQIKIRGFRIELSEIEAVLVEHPMIKAAAVGVTEVSQMKELAAYVVCHENVAELDRQEVADILRAKVPAYMVPQYLDVVTELPMMTSGKIDRKNLPTPQSLLNGPDSIVAPADELEKAIADAWREAFRLPEISVESDFFMDLGGHSLLAAQSVSLMRVALGSMPISVRDFYEYRTVRQLAAVLRTRVAGEVRAGGKDNQGSPPKARPLRVHPIVRWTTVTLQALTVIVFYGLVAAPLAYAAIMISSVIDGTVPWETAASISTMVGFAAWPSMLLLSIAVKWLVIGRYKPGRYPLWSFYYYRWWVASRFQALSWAEIFSGTPLMNLYWRAMGAKVGRNVTICTSLCTAFDVVSIGDDTSVGLETQILGYRVEDGCLVIAPVSVGTGCFIGMHCNLGLSTSMSDGARLDDMSLLPDGATIAVNEGWRGSPARPADVVVPQSIGNRPGRLRVTAFGVLHLALIYAMGYFLIATSLPAIGLIVGGYILSGAMGAALATFVAVPVTILSYVSGAILFKKVLGRIEAGQVKLHTFKYVKHWFTSYLLDNTKTLLMPLYATVYLPGFLRALGAKVGRGSEISTVSHINPDLLEIGDGSFLADACIVGGQRVNAGVLQVGPVRIGAKSFIGNSALVSGNHTIGDNCLIGVASTAPAGISDVPNDTRWLGSPGFALPRTQRDLCFADDQIFKPSRWAVAERILTDTGRILLPGFIFAADSIALVACAITAYHALPLWQAVGVIALAATALAFISVAITAFVKTLFSGQLWPIVKPLWSRFVWHNELVNGVYESVAAPAMTPLLGTPFLAPCLRMMGCKVGKWCFLETTLFSEFDLVVIGDRACLNLGATVQTHLFEDRVFKADYLRIGDDCSVGNMAVVLYGTEMQSGSKLAPLSVLMKGEILPPETNWHGIPCEPVLPAAAAPMAEDEVLTPASAAAMDVLQPDQGRLQKAA